MYVLKVRVRKAMPREWQSGIASGHIVLLLVVLPIPVDA